MSIFSGLGGILGSLFEQFGGPEVILTQVINQMGGVDGLLEKLREAGLGDQVASWIGTGPNQTINPQAISDALGHGPLADLASRFGIPPDQLAQMVAHTLPGLIDKLSPSGHLQPQLLDQGS